jgi:hypothetical protein
MTKLTKLALIFGAFALVPGAALAHGSRKPSHGGVVQMSGEIMVELVTKPKSLEIYVTEEDEPIPAAGFDGALIVTAADGAKSRTVLSAAGGNRFTAPSRPPSGAKVVVSLTAKQGGAKTFVTFRMK